MYLETFEIEAWDGFPEADCYICSDNAKLRAENMELEHRVQELEKAVKALS